MKEAVGLVVWAVRGVRRSGQYHFGERGHAAGPDTLLAERYARGEIDEDEFLGRRELLCTAAGPRR